MRSARLVLAPRLLDLDHDLDFIVHLPDHVERSRDKREAVFFRESESTARIGTSANLPFANLSRVPRHRGLDVIADQALQIRRILGPTRQPLRHSSGREIEKRTA